MIYIYYTIIVECVYKIRIPRFSMFIFDVKFIKTIYSNYFHCFQIVLNLLRYQPITSTYTNCVCTLQLIKYEYKKLVKNDIADLMYNVFVVTVSETNS